MAKIYAGKPTKEDPVNSTIYLFIETLGIFSCVKEATQATRPIVIAKNNDEIVAVRILDFGPITGEPDAPVYNQPSLEKIVLENIGKEAKLSDIKEILQKMDEENIFFAYKSF